MYGLLMAKVVSLWAKKENDYAIPMKYSYSEYPANPNGSDFDAAAICTKDGRHIAMMPHIERSIFLWQWPYCNKIQKI